MRPWFRADGLPVACPPVGHVLEVEMQLSAKSRSMQRSAPVTVPGPGAKMYLYFSYNRECVEVLHVFTCHLFHLCALKMAMHIEIWWTLNRILVRKCECTNSTCASHDLFHVHQGPASHQSCEFETPSRQMTNLRPARRPSTNPTPKTHTHTHCMG